MRKSLLFLLSTSFFCVPVAAQEQSGDTQITVLATGTHETLQTSGQPLTIIGREEIEQVQGGDIVRVLERAPGIAASRNGGIGSFTGVRLRGADAEQLLVLIDGVRVADPAAPGGGFDFATLLPGGIERIELLRSSNGTIWGSQAIGGVLAAWSGFDPGVEGSAEYGAPDTLYTTARAGIAHGPLELAADGAWYRTDGFSAAASGSEPDGFRQWQAGGRGRLAIAPGLRLRGGLRYADARVEIDGFPAPAFSLADTREYQDTRRLSGSAGLEFDGRNLQLTGGWSASDTERDSFDLDLGTAPTFTTDGRSDRLDLRGAWRLGQATVWFGGESEWSSFSSTFDDEQRARTSGVYAQLGAAVSEGVSLNAGARLADHSRFGSAVTFGADASWAFGGGWRLRASFGEGFKAPTLFQLFSDYGNTALEPERSTSADLGIELNDRNAPLHLAATVFRRDSEDLIEFVSCFGNTSGICTDRPFGTYDNVGRVRAQGLEIEARHDLTEALSARVAYSFVETENRTPGSPNRGNVLARRPRHALSLGGEWRVTPAGAAVGADLRWVSASYDDAANQVRMSPRAVVDFTARWPVTDVVELFGRVENLLDEEYETAAGYASAGRGAFVGARLRL
ncbi:TonB-dependent receptor [Altererythrobacter soli]|uniref:TonB-dependent receptor n=1 Tax=Croceibacterium soli TaxID=1739690 RepID=A0A6I4UQG3_9SPHN|nr:TonB-dependent receptor [Croceibacterium soli]